MGKEKLVPELRFPEFDGAWELKRIDEIAPLQRGFDLPVDNIISGEYPVVFSNGILKYHCEFKVKSPGVVTGRSGTIGKVTFVEKDFWPHNTSLWVTDFRNNSAKFIFYFYSRLNLEKYGTGSGVPTLNRNDIHCKKEFIPTQEEQIRIATFLTAVDKRITLLTEKKEKLEQYKKGVMQMIFNQEIRFKDENGKDFPEWEEKRLGEVCEIKSGLSKDQNGKIEGYKVTRIETISDGIINIDKVGYIDIIDNISNYKIQKGDILFSNINSVSHIGKTAIAYSDLDLYHGMNLLCLKCQDGFYPLFLYYILNTVKVRNYFKSICNQAVSQASINQTELGKTILDIPSFPEQTCIASFLTALDQQIEKVDAQIGEMKQWKKGLLQKMFI